MDQDQVLSPLRQRWMMPTARASALGQREVPVDVAPCCGHLPATATRWTGALGWHPGSKGGVVASETMSGAVWLLAELFGCQHQEQFLAILEDVFASVEGEPLRDRVEALGLPPGLEDEATKALLDLDRQLRTCKTKFLVSDVDGVLRFEAQFSGDPPRDSELHRLHTAYVTAWIAARDVLRYWPTDLEKDFEEIVRSSLQEVRSTLERELRLTNESLATVVQGDPGVQPGLSGSTGVPERMKFPDHTMSRVMEVTRTPGSRRHQGRARLSKRFGRTQVPEEVHYLVLDVPSTSTLTACRDFVRARTSQSVEIVSYVLENHLAVARTDLESKATQVRIHAGWVKDEWIKEGNHAG